MQIIHVIFNQICGSLTDILNQPSTRSPLHFRHVKFLIVKRQLTSWHNNHILICYNDNVLILEKKYIRAEGDIGL